MTREQWLQSAALAMEDWFADLGFTVPSYEVRIGFPSGGKRTSNTAESWAADEHGEHLIFVRPDNDNPLEIVNAIALQFCRITASGRDPKGTLFKHLAISIGLSGRQTEGSPGLMFKELAAPILKKIGPIPDLNLKQPTKSGKKPQSGRLIKVSCPECGYIARVSRKWLEELGPPICPAHGVMTES